MIVETIPDIAGEEKPILAIETSGEQCGVCVFWNNEKYVETTSRIKFSHSKKIFTIVENTLSTAEISLNDISAIAVSIGPGSFTGLRIGLAAAKGMALGASLPIVPVPTFEAIAMEALSYTKKGEKFFIANKVNKEEIYFAGFINMGNIYKFVQQLGIVSRIELENNYSSVIMFGNAGNKRLIFPPARAIASWSWLYGKKFELTNYDLLEPLYVKDFLVKGSKIK
ncbi:MAG: tRNA (adenosine(37)-N6)-threonylcarbamoyltransferase complex dimerization subunit type 1 TsaB [Ignavibacteria bacterium CG_4_8_14_3_um_filter_37_9]|nr:MAG: tRNA (adenosine(37)-N6)-threonylcarbamoyltransferase complex dimerization subunit type 1 TsaB [Ignavibacteria bacterium CG_4_8_14_3_um_filter_37_9]